MITCRGALIAIACLASFAAWAQSPSCEVKHESFVNGGMAQATMDLDQGGTCQFKFRFGGQNAPDTWEVIEPPKSGKIVAKDDYAEYQPAGDFTGQDKFVIAIFGKNPNCSTRCTRNGRFDVAVTVKPKA